MNRRPVPTALLMIAAFLAAYLWAYHYSTPEPVERRQVTDMTVAPAIETDVAPGAPTSEEAP